MGLGLALLYLGRMVIYLSTEGQEQPLFSSGNFGILCIKFYTEPYIHSSLGKQEASEATLETLKAIDHPLSKQVSVLVEICSYAGL